MHEDWIDIGTPEEFKKLNKNLNNNLEDLL